ncbi:cyclic peptide export ABC transporter [Sporanaerobacter sp. PP17-6a]|uniref:cyclic peptide export ABC transporter n=1 Tax=Sporanaerobacter sp. PP17-6a TaxID=1891289 RepID=UPI0008A03F6D|nr:cyclic peptide export ABC transporter [Sporanaerobacter sp. PP17-6a]SCL83826.1 FmtA-like protein [Sporanaerobacter sp. PP17-6a]
MKNFNGLPAVLIIFLCMILLPFKTYALTDDTNIKIEKFIKENMDKGKIPGLFVTVVKDDKTVYEKGFGYSDVEKKERVTLKSLFEIGSNSKAFTALGILKLQKEGLIELNDEVTDYIPWLKVKYKGREVPVTIEQLLHHTSGIPFKTIDNIPVSNDDNAIDETVRTLIGIELDSEPGERFQYATINYDVLGLIIEKVTGSSYEEYIEENILKPMGLNNTYLYRDEDIGENVAKGYKIEFLKPALYDAPTYRGNKPAGYIMSNGEDMGKWLKIQMETYNSSRFDRELIEESHNPNRKVPPLEDGSSYADGWYVYQRGGGEISHGGNNPNYSSFILFRPEDKAGIAVLGNTNSEYVGYIARGINGILQGEDYYEDVNDLNKNADMISVLLILISVLIIAGTLFFTVKALKEVLRKERILNKKDSKGIFKFIFSLIFMIGLSYSIYLIPNILYRGVSWDFVFVWLPKTVKTALYLVYISIWAVYVYSVFISLYKKEGDKSILILSVLSVLSGFGNALIIFTINMAIRSGNDEKVKLLMYFILGIILYVYGQRIMRIRMIEITNGIVYSKRMEIVKGLLKTPYNKFEEIDKGRIQSTLNNDTETISRFVNIIISGVTSAITLICCFIYLGFINIYALLLSVIIILFIAGIYYLVGRYANRIGEEARDLQNIFFKFINDLIGGFKELSLNGKRKEEFQEDLEESCDRYKVKRGQSALAFANMFVVGELLFTLAIGAVVFILPLILKNLKEVILESYVFILLYMTGPVHGILNAIPNAIEVRISLKRINGLLSQISSSDGKNNDSGINKKEDKIILKLKGIEYVYDKDGENSFKVGPIDYEFKSGEIFFITGGNGSGKSTLAKLLTGLYVPSKGYITLNGNRVSGRELSEKYSGVFSDFYLFDKLYGIDYKDKEEEIRKYLEILQLDNKVRIKEGKFDTIKLSTGQKKRLALLVAYLEDRPIYIFDEWAADQDPEFRLFFYDTILPELKERGKCVIAITHDDRYFNVADKIIKMDMGSFQI